MLYLFLSLFAGIVYPGDAYTATVSIYADAPISAVAEVSTPWGVEQQAFAAAYDQPATLHYRVSVPAGTQPGVYAVTLRVGGATRTERFAVCCATWPPARQSGSRVWLPLVGR